jgi:hypothetical protein
MWVKQNTMRRRRPIMFVLPYIFLLLLPFSAASLTSATQMHPPVVVKIGTPYLEEWHAGSPPRRLPLPKK